MPGRHPLRWHSSGFAAGTSNQLRPAWLGQHFHGSSRQAPGHPVTAPRMVRETEALATSTMLSIHKQIAGRPSRGIVGEITKRAWGTRPQAF